MRALGVFILLTVVAMRSSAQSDFKFVDSAGRQLFEAGQWQQLATIGKHAEQNSLDYFGLNYRTGVAFYMLEKYAAAEHFFRKAFAQNNTSKETGDYLYGSLSEQGKDLEAGKLQRQYPFISGGQAKKIFESSYAEGGLKFSNDPDKAGNVTYGCLGLTSKPGAGMRLWQTFTYLHQDKNENGFQQYEYFISLPVYLKNYWYIKPSLHWAYTDYSSRFFQSLPVDYFMDYGITSYHTYGTQLITYQQPGKINSLHTALSISRRIENLTIEAEPSFHYISNRYKLNFTYVTNGVTDSLQNGNLQGSTLYNETGAGNTNDTTTTHFIGQAGLFIAYRFPFWQEKIMLRTGVFYLFDNAQTNVAVSAYGLIRFNKDIWLHLSYLYKNELPLSLTFEGQYFNAANPVKNRVNGSLQLFPLKLFTPLLTYQFEQQTDRTSNQTINYNAVYLTLKFNL